MRRVVVSFVVVVAALIGSLAPFGSTAARALSSSDFRSGFIISDERFFDSNSMTEAAIQAFLNSAQPNCRGANGYTCLRYSQFDTTTKAPSGRCSGYNGAYGEFAARVIARVALACGVNPQVLIVMLEKEQGLVTASSPTERQYRVAMGYGCPDTAPCDAQFYGFFNQVWKAAWQLRQYGVNPQNWRYRVGSVAIQYSPNAACGASIVNILNQATAALYNYTPYQPNAAALARLTGIGDGCSSYGNRNFWVYFNNWFGSPTGPDGRPALAEEYARQGGSAGPLGSATSDVIYIPKWGAGLGQAYQGGSIYWTWTGGAHTVFDDAIRAYYFARDGASGPLGWPISDRQSIAGNGGGIAQAFSFGSVYSSRAGAYLLSGMTREGYFAGGAAAGPLGWPTEEASCSQNLANICSQRFGGGAVYSRPAGGYALTTAFDTAFRAAGGLTGSWGWPQMSTTRIEANGGGWGQSFDNLSAFSRDGQSVITVSGPMRDFYFTRSGAAGSLGWPIAAQSCNSADRCTQAFENGVVSQSGQVTTISIPQIEAAYKSAGGQNGMGATQSEPMAIAANGGGWGQSYVRGSIYLSKGATAAFPVLDPFRSVYFASGGSAGTFGWPTSASSCAADVCQQLFDSGSIVRSGAGTLPVKGAIAASYAAAGGSTGSWGFPVTGPLPLRGGAAQAFSSVSVYQAPGASPLTVSGSIRDAYFARGGATGSLGWPTSPANCASDGVCWQQFEGGGVIATALGTFGTTSPVLDAYLASRTSSSGWGRPTSNADALMAGGSSGVAQAFESVSIYHRAGGQPVAVGGAIRDAYFARGGAFGPLGWPAAGPVCGSGRCTQNFDRGTIADTGTVVMR